MRAVVCKRVCAFTSVCLNCSVCKRESGREGVRAECECICGLEGECVCLCGFVRGCACCSMLERMYIYLCVLKLL